MNFELIKRVRKSHGMNQADFWSRVGVTQSGGSRYEHGREIPEPVKKLLLIAYSFKNDAKKEVRALREGLV